MIQSYYSGCLFEICQLCGGDVFEHNANLYIVVQGLDPKLFSDKVYAVNLSDGYFEVFDKHTSVVHHLNANVRLFLGQKEA